MQRRHTRLAAVLTAGLAGTTLALGTSAVVGSAQGAAAAPGDSPARLYVPEKVIAYAYDGQVWTDLGLRLVAPVDAFEIRAHRPSYDNVIQAEWLPADGPAVPLEAGMMNDFSGLADFLETTITRVSTGEVAFERSFDACLNGDSQRITPDGPARSGYPWGCPWNPYTVGSVMGVQGGHASTLATPFQESLPLRPGKYDVATSISQRYVDFFGIDAADASGVTRLVVKRDEFSEDHAGHRATAPRSDLAEPHAHAPARPSAGEVAGTAPDMRSLPAWGIQLNKKGTVLRFAATVWNAGDSPLVVDGFRRPGEDVMDAYQYFFDAEGNETGHQAVGEMHWHAHNHNHWHFEDFARYRLLNEDLSQAVLSTKQSFCLANTDAVDYTVPGADWHPENTDLSTACGGYDALSVRQVLSSGSGDTYLQYRAGQAFPIKNLPNGTYWLAVEANPIVGPEDARNLVEHDTTNNDSLRKIVLKGKPDNRRVVVEQVGIIDETMPGWMRR